MGIRRGGRGHRHRPALARAGRVRQVLVGHDGRRVRGVMHQLVRLQPVPEVLPGSQVEAPDRQATALAEQLQRVGDARLQERRAVLAHAPHDGGRRPRVLHRGAGAGEERGHEPPDGARIAGIRAQPAGAGDQHQLVVRGDPQLVRGEIGGLLLHLLADLDRLDVAVPADDRVDLAGQDRRHQVVADGLIRHLLAGQVAGVQQGRVERVVARDPGEPHRVALDLAQAGDPELRRDDEPVERDGDDRGDRGHRQVRLLGVEELRLVGDGQVGLAQPDELERVGGAGGHPEVHRQVLPGEVSLVLGVVEAHVIGVRHPVELDVERGGMRASRPRCGRWVTAAGGGEDGERQARDQPAPAGGGEPVHGGSFLSDPPRGAQGTKIRSSSDTTPKSTSATAVSSTIAAKIRAVSRLGVAASIT